MSEPDDLRRAVRAWCEKGEADLRSAHVLLDADPPLTDAVCFHSQQAAEKYLKSFLVHHGVEPPYTHSLTTLLSLCIQHDASLDAFFGQAEALSPFAVHVRYPGIEDSPDSDTATSAIASAEVLCDGVRSRLPGTK